MEHNQQHLPRSRGYSVHYESTEPVVALSGEDGDSVQGHEDPGFHAHHSMAVDGFGFQSGGEQHKCRQPTLPVLKIRPSTNLLTLSVALVCSGCIPYQFTTRPGASGLVVDALNGIPIEGARVSVTPMRSDEPVGVATTSVDGSFLVQPRHQWGVYIVPGDIFPFPFRLSVDHDGYQRTTIQFNHRAMGQGTATNFGVLRLGKLMK